MEVSRIFDILTNFKELYPREDALASKKNKEWVKISSQKYYELSHLFSYGLLALGFKKEDKILTISNNRPEWNIMDMGMSQIGVVHVPIYSTLGKEEFAYIFKHSEAKGIVISDKSIYKNVSEVLQNSSNIKHVFIIDSFNDDLKTWQSIIDLGNENQAKYADKVEKIKSSIAPNDLASLIYTSGTTGVSKGVMLSHANLLSNLNGAGFMPLQYTDKALSFLPLCHVYERGLNYVMQSKGVGIYYAQNMGTIVNDLKEVQPQGFDTVPRLLEKVYDKIMQKGKDLKGIKKQLFDWAVNLGLRYEFNGANGWLYEKQLALANKLIFTKWREALGGNIKFIGCGGAALQPRLMRIFSAAQIPIQEGYGLTETSPLVAINHDTWPNKMIGTVGPVMPKVDVKIAEDGEILTKGPQLMLGYYKEPELTKEVIDQEGWFHTGDIGEFVNGKFLKITDRKKEMFKTAAGKYIAPQAIENKLKESFFIEQAMVVGQDEKFASALLTPNFDFLHSWAAENQIHYRDNEELVKNKEVVKRLQQEVNGVNDTLGEFEKIKRFRMVCDEWSPETGELSAKMSLKRRNIYEKYAVILEGIYGHELKSITIQREKEAATKKKK
jgi:long-chain acyl-CoA synthetase